MHGLSLALGLLLSAQAHIRMISEDMTLPHDARPSGVGGADWGAKARVGMGHDPKGFTAFVAWGQIYVKEGSVPPLDSWVEIRGLQAFILSRKTGKWRRVQYDDQVSGAAYREDFQGDLNKPANVVRTPEGYARVRLEKGYNCHFWGRDRVAIDPSDIGGVVTAVHARLLGPGKPDTLLMSVGADYWKSMGALWDNWKTNGDVGIGRFRFISPRGGWHAMTTLSLAELQKNPPPRPTLE